MGLAFSVVRPHAWDVSFVRVLFCLQGDILLHVSTSSEEKFFHIQREHSLSREVPLPNRIHLTLIVPKYF